MLPLIDHEVTAKGWIQPEEFIDIVAITGMAPGPAATNAAIVVGYHVAGIPGAVISTVGMILPSQSVILLVAMFFIKIQEHPLIKSAFYGLRPVITGLIFYAAIVFTLRNHIIGMGEELQPLNIGILAVSLLLFFFTKIHPVFIIVGSGVFGILFGS